MKKCGEKEREMKDSYSIIKTPDGFYDLFQNEFNSDGILLSQNLVKRYKTISGSKNALIRYEREKRREEGRKIVEELDLSDFKLLPDAKPSLFHYQTVRGNIPQSLWLHKIRPCILERQGKTCSICGWTPKNDFELRKLHLHEIEDYDFQNVVCHLKDIDLICEKCHAFHHIARTKMVLTKEKWEDLLKHFIKVNDCSSEIIEHWASFENKVFRLKNENDKNQDKDLPSIHELMSRTVRYTVSPNIPFADEIIKQLEQKGILYQPEAY
jgi:hypothetical protein